ncbi:MAG: VWA domain-containing protein [Planctomycetes bacterium]|nr:VWA domain-containing protein [Planctomycetota bacterium]
MDTGGTPCPSVTIEPADRRFAGKCPLAATEATVRVAGLVAEFDLRQRFVNTAAEPLEAVLRLPVPDDAVVRSLLLRQGGRTLESSVKEKGEAHEAYADARDRGRRGALAEEVRENLVLLSVTGIAPQVPIDVHVVIAAPVAFDGGEATLTLPTTLTPRYCPEGMPLEDAKRVSPPFVKGERLYGLSFALDIDAGTPITEVRSPSHALVVERPSARHAVVRLKEGDVLPDRDLIVHWGLDTALDRPILATARASDGGPAAVMLALPPPASAGDEDILPRHVSFLLDRSGSMGGEPIESGRRALRGFVRGLGPRDHFGILAFDDRVEALAPRPFSDDALRAADEFLEKVHARGGTQILPALEEALGHPAGEGSVRTVVLLTDGSVGNEEEITRRVEKAARGQGLRAHAIGIGPSVNRALVRRFARAGRGMAEFVPAAADLEPMLARFQARSGAPLATEVSLETQGAPIVDFTPAVPSDVDLGRPVVLFAKALEDGRATVVLRAKVAAKGGKAATIERRYELEIPAGRHGHPALPALWARSRIADLVEADATANRDEVLRLSLAHQVLSPFTSLVAVDREDAGTGKAPRTVEVPVHLPKGLTMDLAQDPFPGGVGGRVLFSLGAMPQVLGSAPAAPSVACAAPPPSTRMARPAGGPVSARGSFMPPPPPPPARDAGLPAEAARLVGSAARSAPAPVGASGGGAASGGTPRADVPDTERIAAALRFLARSQSASGAWGDAGTTRLVVEAFAAAGQTAQRGNYRRQLARAEAFLKTAPAATPLPGTAAGGTIPAAGDLAATQVFGGADDGSVVGLGDAIVMTAVLVRHLAAKAS